jgi:hypothetical protein
MGRRRIAGHPGGPTTSSSAIRARLALDELTASMGYIVIKFGGAPYGSRIAVGLTAILAHAEAQSPFHGESAAHAVADVPWCVTGKRVSVPNMRGSLPCRALPPQASAVRSQ